MSFKKYDLIILPMKPMVQKHTYDCGLWALKGILKTKGIEIGEKKLRDMLGTNYNDGTKPEWIKSVLTQLGVEYTEIHNGKMSDIEAELAKSKVCLVAFQAWGTQKQYDILDSGHYSVIFGMRKESLWLADPSVVSRRTRFGRGVRRIDKKVFEKRWVDKDSSDVLYDHWMLAI